MPKDTVFYKKNTLNLKGKVVDLSTPVVMGIINVTPDSFFIGSRVNNERDILERVVSMLNSGGLLIDIGGYSSRPGSDHIAEEEELERVIPVIKFLFKELPDLLISVDTFRSTVARAALDEGACMINDISGGQDKKMFATVAEYKAAYVLMHMKGTAQTMIDHAKYNNILLELLDYFSERIERLQFLGVKDIIIDPGFGFAKNIEHNYSVLRDLNYLEILNRPILAGLSRKSMIYKKLKVNSEDALNGTTVLNTISLMKGASILRVHDVKEAFETIKLFKLTQI